MHRAKAGDAAHERVDGGLHQGAGDRVAPVAQDVGASLERLDEMLPWRYAQKTGRNRLRATAQGGAHQPVTEFRRVALDLLELGYADSRETPVYRAVGGVFRAASEKIRQVFLSNAAGWR